MGVFDKLKNALFEVEYVEVEEKPKKEKKSKHYFKKDREEKQETEKPIAKKIVLPKKEDKIEQLEEEELKDENFEVRPKNETLKEQKPAFKFMDDEDFEVIEEPKIVEAYAVDEMNNDTFEEKHHRNRYQSEEKDEYNSRSDNQSTSSFSSLEKPKVDNSYNSKESRPYGVDNSYNVPVHEYGTYEKKEEKQYFKPSPIISPIYGILDKNYKKEDVVSKKEIRITSNYSRTNVNVDDIRNKAFGRRVDKRENTEPENNTFEVEEDDDNLLVDLTNENDKPEVKEVTVGDAMEYFQDLGLEYNVDYVDASKEKKNIKKQPEEKIEEKEKIKEKEKTITKKEEVKAEKIKEEKPTVKVENESKNNETKDMDDDNLFDLIDSMYSEDN